MKGLIALLLAACSGAPTTSSWAELGEVGFDEEGRTPQVSVPWAAGQHGVVIEASSVPSRCFQVDELTSEDGGVYEQRTAVAAGGALYVLPSRGGALDGLRVRFGLRDCETFTRDATPGATLRLRASPVRQRPLSGTVDLHLVVTPASQFWGASEAAFSPLLEALDAELSSAGIVVRLKTLSMLPSTATSDATFSRGDPRDLHALLSQAPASSTATIPVVLAGCLRLTEPVLRNATEPEGYSPHIPGGAGPGDGVYLRGTLCGTPGPVQVQWSNSALARVMAHELGHYLGLFHSVEADGTADELDDTSAQNLMYFRPSVAGSTGLSPQQGEVMRLHPSVR